MGFHFCFGDEDDNDDDGGLVWELSKLVQIFTLLDVSGRKG